MAHYFEQGFFVGKPAWHKFGTVLSDYPTIEAAYELSGHNFQVASAPCYDERGAELPDFIRRVIRTDTRKTIGKCASSYTPVQNKSMYDFIQVLHGEDEKIKIDTAGVLKGGQWVWTLTLVNETRPAGDDLKLYMLVYNQHNAGQSLKIQMTNVRVQCWNTLSLAMNEANNVIAIRHTGDVQARIAQAKKAIKHTMRYSQSFDHLVTLLAAQPASNEFVEKVALRLWPAPQDNSRDSGERHRRAVLENFKRYCSLNNGSAAGATLWGAVNAITHYVDHQKHSMTPARSRKAKALAAQKAEKRNERTFQSVLLGAEMAFKAQAVETVCELACKSYSAELHKELRDFFPALKNLN